MNILKENTSRKKITILVFPFNLLSHYLRCIVLSNRYSKTEYEFLFLESDLYSKYVIENGYQTFSVRQFDSKFVMQCSEKFSFKWLSRGSIEEIFQSQIDAIKRLKPDAVIGDVAPTLKMASEFTGVHYIALMNGYLTKYYRFSRQLSRTHFSYNIIKLFPKTLACKIVDSAEKNSFIKIYKPFKRLREIIPIIKCGKLP